MRYHPARMAIIENKKTHKCWCGYGEKGTLVHCWWEYKLMQPVRKTVWSFRKQIKNRIIIQSGKSISESISKGIEIKIQTDIYTAMYCSQ